MEETELAIKAFKRAITLSPKAFEPLHHLGRLLLAGSYFDKAISILQRAISANQSVDAVWSDLAIAQKGAGDIAGAIQSLKNAIQLNPRSAIPLYNLAECCRETGQDKEALRILNELIISNPRFVEAHILAASILSDRKDIDGAISLLEKCLASHPGHIDCLQNMALIQLRAGRLAQGFESYLWRLTPSKNSVAIRPFSHKLWHGQSLETDKLLLGLEQGIGADILSVSLLQDIIKLAPNCIVECDARLVDLLVRSFPQVRFVSRCDPPAPETAKANYVSPMWSTARILRQNWDQLPKEGAYLVADQERVDNLRNRYKAIAGDRKIIGLSWASSAVGGRLKTPPLETWKPLLDDSNQLIISLQHAAHPQDIAILNQIGKSEIHIDHSIDATKDFDQAATQISALDAVVSISNSTAHLSGALGTQTATLVPKGFGSFWYWHHDVKQNPWYPTMRLCRQNKPGDWQSAISDACKWLKYQ